MAKLDRSLLFAIIALIALGLVQVYSTSFIYAVETRGDALYFFKRQLLFSVLGIGLLLGVAIIPWNWIRKFYYLPWVFALILLVGTFIPGIGSRAGGASRWINIPVINLNFEPSELLKVSLSILLAGLLSSSFLPFEPITFNMAQQEQNQKHKRRKGSYWFWVAFILILIPLILLLRQPDFGSFVICLLVTLGVLFAFGLPWSYMAWGATFALPAFYFLVMRVPYRKARVLAFLDPWSDPSSKGFQVIQSLLSYQNGGFWGVGLGQGQGKLFFLPEAHTDFTLAVFAEELGYMGFLILMTVYAWVIFVGLRTAVRIEDRMSQAMSLGLTLTFSFQVVINVGVSLGMLPTKGLTLPFLSYGGSSLLMTCVLFGLLLNIRRRI